MKFTFGLGFAVLCAALTGCHGDKTAAPGRSLTKSEPQVKELLKEDIKVGKGPAAAPGDTVMMEYRGTFADGTEFDGNVPVDPKHPDKPPYPVVLQEGRASVIDGWNRGIVGMKAGGERKLSIPWSMAYGAEGKAPIPPKTDLYFNVKVLAIVKAGQESRYAVTEVKTGTGPPVTSGDWVAINYTAKLMNGKLIEASTKPLPFQAGTGEMDGKNIVPIKGVVAGVVGMRAGGDRILDCPAMIATNPQQPNEDIPPNSMIRFEVKLLRVQKHPWPTTPAPKS